MKYNAFISYRHAEPDSYVAELIHKRLETFRVPRRIQRLSGIKKIERVFRDQEELPIDSSLSDNIEAALAESEYLIVICSPRLPESRWCRSEIESFIRMHDRDHILAVLVEGEPDEAFPDLIRFDEAGKPVEPLAADVRGGSRREIRKKLDGELLRLLAPLLHCSYDDLRQRHRERRIRRIMAIMAAAMALLVGFAGYYAYTAAQITRNYRDKQINQSKYLADTALEQLEQGDRLTAISVALEALPYSEERPYVAKAEYALNETLYTYHTGYDLLPDRVLSHSMPVSEFIFNDEGNMLLTVDQADTVTLWDVESGERLREAAAPMNRYGESADVNAVCFAGDSVVIGYEDGAYCYDIATKDLKWGRETELLREMIYSPENDMVILSTYEGLLGVSAEDGSEAFLISDAGKYIDTDGEEYEYSFGWRLAVSADGKYAAVSCEKEYGHREGAGKVLVIDIGAAGLYETNGGSPKPAEPVEYSFSTTGNYALELFFLSDDTLLVASDTMEGAGTLSGNGQIERFSISGDGFYEYNLPMMAAAEDEAAENETAESDVLLIPPIWTSPLQYNVYVFQGSSLHFYERDYTGADGGHHEIIYYMNNDLVSLDFDSGETIAALKKSSSITGCYPRDNNGYVLVTEWNGVLDYQDMTTGQEYNDNMKETGIVMVETDSKNSVMAARGYLSPDIVLLRYETGEGLETAAEFDENVSSVRLAPEAGLIAVETYWDATIRLLNAESFEETDVFSINDGTIKNWAIAPNGTLYVYSEGALLRYDPDTGERIEYISENRSMSESAFDIEHGRFLAYGLGIEVVDISTMRSIIDERPETPIEIAALGGETGDTLLAIDKENEILLYDLSDVDAEPRKLSDDRLATYTSYATAHNVALSPDGKRLAINCLDGYARVYDIESGEVTDEIPYEARLRAYLDFSDDGRLLRMQGDDYYFRVYDTEAHSMYHLADDQYYAFEDISEEDGLAIVRSTSVLYILDADTYDLKCEIEGGEAYDAANRRLYIKKYGSLYTSPYYSLDELYGLAEAQLGGYELSEEKRLQLNLD